MLTHCRCLLAAMLVLAPALSIAQDVPEAIRRQGFLRVGIEATYPPMAYKDPATNERRGLNVDLVTAIGQELALEIRWEEMAFAQLIPAITTDRVDFSGSSMTDLPARREKLSFVDYVSTGAQVFTTAAQQKGAMRPADFCGRSLATPRTTNYFPQAQAWSEAHCVAAGRAPIRVIGTEGAAAARADLQQGRADGAILGAEYVVFLQQQNPGTFVAIGEPISRNLSGMAFARDKTALRDAVAGALSRMVADGRYAAILARHGLDRQALPAITIDAGE
ncbi:ABC transporter substrate-binding protein [Teichococcus vastitatis]|jgi:polar amino acid transport system substrate-binding protein|uniref:ABC transporter substrate-binding protein n=1 Tax=Teichococcus vastitatis TaxID=2307076 RepID=A0ABS9VZ76_9PROT|nr:ABC transporter substrate-binding protein [Pseudoroseomonas vastitatis]MCI0752218.1 ABC transporter substrate-binding protein [Pseudoroseomonas vastitatis]